jgi:hypothetical protein
MSGTARVLRDLEKINQDPPPGIAVWPKEEGVVTVLEASKRRGDLMLWRERLKGRKV